MSMSCPLCCSSTFANARDLVAHLRRAAQNLRCPNCRVPCSTLNSLIDHISSCYGVSERGRRQPTMNGSASQNRSSSRRINGNIDAGAGSSDEEDGNGYYCMECDLQIPSVEEHIAEFHSGQEIILEEDESGEEEVIEEDDVDKAILKRGNADTEDWTEQDPAFQSTAAGRARRKRSAHGFIPKTTSRQRRLAPTASRNSLVFSSDEEVLDDIKEIDNGEDYYCTVCRGTFSGVDNHIKKFHKFQDAVLMEVDETLTLNTLRKKNRNDKFGCHECLSRFSTKSALCEHLNEQHKIETEGHPRMIEHESPVEDEDPEQVKPGTASKLRPLPYVSPQENPSTSRQKMKRGINVPKLQQPQKYRCSVCSVVLTDFRVYLQHKDSHEGTEQQLHQCENCNEEFYFSSSLKIHVKCVHGGAN